MTLTVTKKSARISLVTVFSAASVGVLSIFILLSYFTFTRLLNFESTLTDVSEKSLPDLIQINQLYSQASTLLESTNILSRSTSDASKRLAERQLQTNLSNFKKSANQLFENQFLDTQLNVITIELEEFSALIEQRLQTINNIESLKSKVYKLNYQAIMNTTQKSSAWALGFSQASVNMNKALNENKLQRVRFLFTQLEKRLDALIPGPETGQNNMIRRQLTNEFKDLLFSQNGMEALKIKSLRLEGRTIGRENFVHSLIEDYVAQIGFVTNETEQSITHQVATSVIKMKEQTQLIRIILISGVVFLLIIAVLFQQRVLKRLRVFNQIVRNQTQELEYRSKLNGNDEITDLAEAFKEFTQTIEIQKQRLEHLSMSDGLTGIANRRALDIRLKHDIELSARHKSSTSLLLMDIDCFKLYNDNYGHSAGDECLKEVAKIISNSIHRDSDFVARYGGEEFVCVLPNTDISGAQEIAADIIQRMKSAALPHIYSKVADYVTISIGIATTHPTDLLTSKAIIKQADTALYISKRAGRNTYRVYKKP